MGDGISKQRGDCHENLGTAEALLFLREINRIAFDMELSAKREIQQQKTCLIRRLSEADEAFLLDFEIECEIQFYLSDDFPGYTDEISEVAAFEICDSVLGSEDNWNEWRFDQDHPLATEHFCYSMKQLVNFALVRGDGREIEKLLYIDRVWCDVKVWLQRVASTSKDRGQKFVSNKGTDAPE